MNLSHHDSEEITQKVFIKLWQQLPERDVINFSRFRSWLCVVTGNTAKDFIRSKSRRHDREVRAGDERYRNYTNPEIEKIAEEEWRTFIVTEAMMSVKNHFSRKIMDIFDALHKGASVAEVAETFDIPPNTVSVYKKRVLSALCEEVKRLDRELK
jgi:RNA polymerase sigma factor (sigma-70 family)